MLSFMIILTLFLSSLCFFSALILIRERIKIKKFYCKPKGEIVNFGLAKEYKSSDDFRDEIFNRIINDKKGDKKWKN